MLTNQATRTASGNNYRILTAGLLVLEFFLLAIPFFILGSVFDFPAILRQPAGEALSLFSKNSTLIVVNYYIFVLSALILIPLSLLLHKIVGAKDSVLMNITTAFGVVMGVVQALGFIRWPFMIPYLADTYQNPASSAATRDAVAVTYEAFNRYAGMAVGEHFGFVMMAAWTVLISVAILRNGTFKPWIAWLGIVLGVAVGVSALEQFGPSFSALAVVNAIATTGWAIWLLIIAAALFLARTQPTAKRAY